MKLKVELALADVQVDFFELGLQLPKSQGSNLRVVLQEIFLFPGSEHRRPTTSLPRAEIDGFFDL